MDLDSMYLDFGSTYLDLGSLIWTLILRISIFDLYVSDPVELLIYVFGQFLYVFGLIKVLRSAY